MRRLLALVLLACAGCPGEGQAPPVPTAPPPPPVIVVAPVPSAAPAELAPAPASDAERLALERAAAKEILAAHQAGVLADVDRAVLERLALRADLRTDALKTDATLADELRRAAREKRLDADGYAGYRALLSPTATADEQRQVARALVDRDDPAGAVRRLLIADLLFRRANGGADGPTPEVEAAVRDLPKTLEAQRDKAVADLSELVKKPAGPDAAAQVRGLTQRRNAAEEELARASALLAFLKSFRLLLRDGLALPDQP